MFAPWLIPAKAYVVLTEGVSYLKFRVIGALSQKHRQGCNAKVGFVRNNEWGKKWDLCK
jgi:hypothetical protein